MYLLRSPKPQLSEASNGTFILIFFLMFCGGSSLLLLPNHLCAVPTAALRTAFSSVPIFRTFHLKALLQASAVCHAWSNANLTPQLVVLRYRIYLHRKLKPLLAEARELTIELNKARERIDCSSFASRSQKATLHF